MRDVKLTGHVDATSQRANALDDLVRSYATPDEMREGLQWALANFRRGSELSDGGRLGMYCALLVITEFARTYLGHSDGQLLGPLECLRRALIDLDSGNVHPALSPRSVRNRKRVRSDVADFKGRCLAAADLLAKHGQVSRSDADTAIFRRVSPSARRLGIRMTEKTLQTWRRDARKAVDDEGQPVTLFGFWSWAMRELAGVNSDAVRDLDARIKYLLDPVSEERLSHLTPVSR